MKNKKNKKKKAKIVKILRPILLLLLFLFLIFGSLYTLKTIALFKGIETPLRICVALIITDLCALLSMIDYKLYFKKAKKVFYVLFIFTLIYSIGITIVSYKVNAMYSKLEGITEDSSKELYSSSIVVKSDATYKNIDDIKNKKIGMISEEENIEGYNIPHQIIEEEKINSKYIRTYDDYYSMIDDLIANKIDAAFLPTSYTIMLESTEGYENLSTTTKIIYTKESEVVNEDFTFEETDITKPFTILIMGVDTTGTGLTSSFNGDALMLITFNPNTLNATILSIPRDSYMPISCMGNKSSKITNAGWYGESCIIKSLENYFDIKIDYYFKVNFKAVVDLVNALDGVEVDVPYSFCEQNSERKWGKKTVFVKAGKQTLNGEQALAFARHRKITNYMVRYCGQEYTSNGEYWNDYTRGQNQQIIIKAILKKLIEKATSFTVIEDLLDTINKNAKTNMSTDTILSLYNLGKDILGKSNNSEQVLNMQRLYLTTYDARVYWSGCGNESGVYVGGIYDESYEAVVDAMKVNLGKKKPTVVKTFNFSIENEYEETVIGKGLKGTTSLKLMPNLIGKTESYARTFASNNNITIVVNYVEGSQGQVVGTIIKQSIHEKTDLNYIGSSRTLTIDVISSIKIDTPIVEVPEVTPTPDTPIDTTPTTPEVPETPITEPTV